MSKTLKDSIYTREAKKKNLFKDLLSDKYRLRNIKKGKLNRQWKQHLKEYLDSE